MTPHHYPLDGSEVNKCVTDVCVPVCAFFHHQLCCESLFPISVLRNPTPQSGSSSSPALSQSFPLLSHTLHWINCSSWTPMSCYLSSELCQVHLLHQTSGEMVAYSSSESICIFCDNRSNNGQSSN